MGVMGDFARKAAADLEVTRKKMERDNLAHMEALAKLEPEPSIETIQRAMGLPKKREAGTVSVASPHVEQRASQARVGADKGGYATRASNPIPSGAPSSNPSPVKAAEPTAVVNEKK